MLTREESRRDWAAVEEMPYTRRLIGNRRPDVTTSGVGQVSTGTPEKWRDRP